MNCSSCGSPIPGNVRFCVKCGAPAEQTPAAGRVQYIPPGQPAVPPPAGPDRILLWSGIALAAIAVIAAAIAIPLLVRGGGGDATTSTTTVLSTTVSDTTTGSATTSTTVASGPAGDSAGSWVEVSVPGGPWAASDVAVSEDALLIRTGTDSPFRLSAVMLGTGDVITLGESDALWGADIDGDLAVWWEGAGWDAATETYADQHIYAYRLPGGPKTLVAGAGAGERMEMPQVALPWVTWVLSTPWVDNPMEYWSERIMHARVDENGAPVGAAGELVPSALAFALGDSGWQYSLSSTHMAWEHATTAEGYDVGTHVIDIHLGDHEWVGGESWRPTLWSDTLVYWDNGLKMTDLSSGDTRDIDPSGDFATAGPTFAAYYRPGGAGSYAVARGYGGVYEQTLGELALPQYWCPVISVSPNHIAYAVDNAIHLFEWQAD